MPTITTFYGKSVGYMFIYSSGSSRTPLDGKRLKMYIMSMREVVVAYERFLFPEKQQKKPSCRCVLYGNGERFVWKRKPFRKEMHFLRNSISSVICHICT